jgi:hypothetical protein
MNTREVVTDLLAPILKTAPPTVFEPKYLDGGCFIPVQTRLRELVSLTSESSLQPVFGCLCEAVAETRNRAI